MSPIHWSDKGVSVLLYKHIYAIFLYLEKSVSRCIPYTSQSSPNHLCIVLLLSTPTPCSLSIQTPPKTLQLGFTTLPPSKPDPPPLPTTSAPSNPTTSSPTPPTASDIPMTDSPHPASADDKVWRDLHTLLLETEVREGKMVCGNCGHEYRIKEGIANFLLPSHLGESELYCCSCSCSCSCSWRSSLRALNLNSVMWEKGQGVRLRGSRPVCVPLVTGCEPGLGEESGEGMKEGHGQRAREVIHRS